VSLFYAFYGEVDAPSAEVQRLIAATVGAEHVSADTIFCEGMNVTVHHVEGNDVENSTGRYFGFAERTSATFTFDNLASSDQRERNVVRMVASVSVIFDAWPGRGVLLHNGERVVLQRLADGVEFDSEWDDWIEIEGVAPYLSAHAARRLMQPLL